MPTALDLLNSSACLEENLLNNPVLNLCIFVHIVIMLCMRMFINFYMFCLSVFVYIPLICIIMGICALHALYQNVYYFLYVFALFIYQIHV